MFIFFKYNVFDLNLHSAKIKIHSYNILLLLLIICNYGTLLYIDHNIIDEELNITLLSDNDENSSQETGLYCEKPQSEQVFIKVFKSFCMPLIKIN